MAPAAGSRPIVSRGDVVLVPFPFTDLTSTKLRPAVVFRAATDQSDFVLAFVSSRVAPQGVGDVVVSPRHPEYGMTGLALASTIRLSKIVTLARSLLVRRIGRLGPLLMADIDQSLVAALGIDIAPYREAGALAARERLRSLAQAGGAKAVIDDLGVQNQQ